MVRLNSRCRRMARSLSTGEVNASSRIPLSRGTTSRAFRCKETVTFAFTTRAAGSSGTPTLPILLVTAHASSRYRLVLEVIHPTVHHHHHFLGGFEPHCARMLTNHVLMHTLSAWQDDGNVVMYKGTPVWSSNTQKK
ncbi:hypothetical protein RRF57_012039 [Xylaria bambusicola]|uniref:Uncharacterized protein n=1 Tax=Xylaria bambusicola TaxID=326684 RepID=A0AAN7UUL2_9PEZI